MSSTFTSWLQVHAEYHIKNIVKINEKNNNMNNNNKIPIIIILIIKK